jgi:DNA-binding NarL/FixJ family response regulator
MSAERSPIRLLVADDDETILSLMLHLLGSLPHFQIVAEAVNGRDAVRLASRTEPQVALLDWYMPLVNAFDAARQIMALRSGPQVLVVSGCPEVRLVLRALRAGVKGYLSKTALAKEAVSAVLRVAAGELYCASS